MRKKLASELLELRTLRIEDEIPFRHAVREFTESESDSHLTFAFDYESSFPFDKYVETVNSWPNGMNLPANFVPNTYYVAVVARKIVGRLSFRHQLNDFLERIGGHIGYCVVPSKRRCGFATEMLRQSLGFARSMGIDRVLVTCDTNNIGSMRVIEANGGIFENTSDEPELKIQKNRYWINL
jgi:predicted acetyltransferase